MEEVENIVSAVIIGGLLLWGGTALLTDESTTTSDTTSSYRSDFFDDEYETDFGESGTDDYSTYDSNSFHGYDCTDDCSGHEAGYQWAEENDISDESDCYSNSNSFDEGCQAYVEENY